MHGVEEQEGCCVDPTQNPRKSWGDAKTQKQPKELPNIYTRPVQSSIGQNRGLGKVSHSSNSPDNQNKRPSFMDGQLKI
jgi:hypothetical protein